MDHLDRFRGNYVQTKAAMKARRSAVTARIDELRPDNIDALLAGSKEIGFDLRWVSVMVPSQQAPEGERMDILPALTLMDSGPEGDQSEVYALTLHGRVPNSGATDMIGAITCLYTRPSMEPVLLLNTGERTLSRTKWESADADIFLGLTEAVLDEVHKGLQAEDLLMTFDSVLAEMEEEGDRLLYSHDLEGYRETKKAQAIFISDMPVVLRSFETQYGRIPANAHGHMELVGAIAARALAQGRTDHMGRILFQPRGSKVTDPTELEQLAYELWRSPNP